MIKAVNFAEYGTNFRSEKPEKEKKAEEYTRLLPNNMKTRLKQSSQKTMSAFIDYPIKGLRGDINSDFYEFLTMGIVPYLAGSAMFMFVFNCLNGILDSRAQKAGKKFALGVVFYGIMKNLSKNFVTQPVKLATGVDTEMPYENIIYPLPKEAGAAANITPLHQQRKVYDSNEFYRKDLLPKEYFAKIAKKNGLGENLNDPVTEAGPIIQNIVSTSNLAKSMTSYCWAGVGVMLAVQKPWDSFFDAISDRKHYHGKKDESLSSKLGGKIKTFWGNALDITKTFGTSFVKSCKSLWNGNPAYTGFMKHAGKTFVGISAAITAFLTANTILRAKNMAKNHNKHTIDKTKESTVI